MYFSGICDEAGKSLATQIQAHRELGWDHVELRRVTDDGGGVSTCSDVQFDAVYRQVTEAGMNVSCFASAIANWARPITGDPQVDYDELERAIPRMKRCRTQFIRIMSYPNDPNHPLPESQWRDEAIRRVTQMARMAEDGGVVLVHENCSGWGGLSAENSNILLGEVDSPALKVVFDTGNPVTYGQDSWDYYQKVYDSIAYIHIKDAKYNPNGKEEYTYCGDGDGYVREILEDVLARGYDGGISIEPHLAAVIHTGQAADTDQALYDSYTEYGRRLMKIVDDVKPKP
jgi:sugar phosphate isomerase/epimerase